MRASPRSERVAGRRLSGALRAGAFSLLAVSALACASSGTRAPAEEPASDRRTLTADELAEAPGTNLYDALQRLRPLWLFTSGSRTRSVNVQSVTIVVTDGRYFGRLDSLRRLPIGGVRQVRYVTGSEASNAYPSVTVGGHVEAAILVEYGNQRSPAGNDGKGPIVP